MEKITIELMSDLLTNTTKLTLSKDSGDFDNMYESNRYILFESKTSIFTYDTELLFIDRDHPEFAGGKLGYCHNDVIVVDFADKWILYSLETKQVVRKIDETMIKLGYDCKKSEDFANIDEINYWCSKTHMMIIGDDSTNIHVYDFAGKNWKEIEIGSIYHEYALYCNCLFYSLENERNILMRCNLDTGKIDEIRRHPDGMSCYIRANKNVLFFGFSGTRLRFYYDMSEGMEIPIPENIRNNKKITYNTYKNEFYYLAKDGIYDKSGKIIDFEYDDFIRIEHLIGRYCDLGTCFYDLELNKIFHANHDISLNLNAIYDIKYDKGKQSEITIFNRKIEFPRILSEFRYLDNRKKNIVATLIILHEIEDSNIIQNIPREILFNVFEFICN